MEGASYSIPTAARLVGWKGRRLGEGRLTEDLLNLSPDDYHPFHERMGRRPFLL